MNVDKAALVQEIPVIRNSARWFWWIAGLSLINSIINLNGGGVSFALGLGITQVADVFLEDNVPVAIVFDAIVIGFFLLMGWLAQRGSLTAFLLGGGLYLADTAIILLTFSIIAIVFHAYVVFCLFRGAKELHVLTKEVRHALREEERQQAGEVTQAGPPTEDPPYIL